MTLPPHTQQAAPAAKPNVTWTIMAPPNVAFQMWIDGSVKLIFSPDKAGEVIASLEQHLNAFKIAKGMLDNPPKKCVGCRGTGQVMVKKGESKEPVVCPKCSGSGMMNFIPPSVSTMKAPEPPAIPAVAGMMTLPRLDDDEPPQVNLPHQTLAQVPDPDSMRDVKRLLQGMGYKVVPLSKEDVAEQLAATTAAAAAEHPITERPGAPVEDDEVVLSLEELAALGKPPKT